MVEEGCLEQSIEEGGFTDVGAAQEGDFGYELGSEAFGGRRVGMALFAPFSGRPEFAGRMGFEEGCCGRQLCRIWRDSVPVIC